MEHLVRYGADLHGDLSSLDGIQEDRMLGQSITMANASGVEQKGIQQINVGGGTKPIWKKYISYRKPLKEVLLTGLSSVQEKSSCRRQIPQGRQQRIKWFSLVFLTHQIESNHKVGQFLAVKSL